MIDSHFSQEALDAVSSMLGTDEFACGDSKKPKGQRTPAQSAADQARSQKMKGRDNMSPAVRSAAAKKGAATRKNCGG